MLNTQHFKRLKFAGCFLHCTSSTTPPCAVVEIALAPRAEYVAPPRQNVIYSLSSQPIKWYRMKRNNNDDAYQR
nr:MAG TPA: hypothetical protein [Caudoviricetes sp.]